MKPQILVKNILFIVVVYVCSTTLTFAQVGIATTSPKATLDIVASNQASPASNDGILIPRVDAFSAIKPTIDQDAMIVYLTTIDGTDAPGFYYWNNTTTSWLPFGGVSSDNDWYAVGTTTAPSSISDNIFTNGNVGIGDSSPDGNLDVSSTGDTLVIIEADSDNSGENDNPEIQLVQDGGDRSSIQLEGTSNNIATGTLANALVLHTRNGESGAPIQMVSNGQLNTTFASNGGVQLNQYTTATSYTGTATSLLGVDALGNIIQEPLSSGTNGWELTGNSGTTNGTNFIGTIDNQNLDIRTNNVIRARFTDKNLEFLNNGRSVHIGEGAGAADDLSTNRNVFIGYEAGNDNVSGFNSVALGYSALSSSIDGIFNIAIGNASLSTVTSGDSNISIGVAALMSNPTSEENIAIGTSALQNSVSGNNNVAIGYSAGVNVDSSDNVFIGHNADWLNNGTNGQNVVIGSGAGQAGSGSGVNYTGRVLMGYQAGRDTAINNTLFIENSASKTPLIGGDFANDRVGVNVDMTGGTTNLTHTLTVGGSVKINTLMNLEPTTAPTLPSRGDVYYDNATNKVRVWTGSVWENLN